MEAGAKAGAWARAGAEELPIKAATTARINRHRTCLSVTLAEFARLWDGFLDYRHPSDDGVIEAGCLEKTKDQGRRFKGKTCNFCQWLTLSGILYG
jgi:hypothetical protein